MGSTRVIVIGCGVSGLTCGVRLVEAGLAVEIWARDLPPRTTSNVAGALWYPYAVGPSERVESWAQSSYVVFRELARTSGSGVRMREGTELFSKPMDAPASIRALPSFRMARPTELKPGYERGSVFEAPVIEMPIYLEYLMRRFLRLGGVIHERSCRSLDEAVLASPIVVNCAGLGARELAGDSSMYAIRGQVVRVERSGLERFLIDEYGSRGITYVVPRSGDCVLGGSAQQGREDLEVDPDEAAAIVERCVALEPSLARAEILSTAIGLRPGRPEVRLEAESPRPDRLVIHDYGHGGAGVTLSWGCADEVLGLVRERVSW